MPMKGSICLVRVSVLLMVVLRASGALAAWVVNERGECVRAWTPASLGRGPAAMLNAPLLPLRSAVGGVRVGRAARGVAASPAARRSGGAPGRLPRRGEQRGRRAGCDVRRPAAPDIRR